MTLSTSRWRSAAAEQFSQLVQQPRVLDGDDGLVGEVGEERDLLVGEWAYLCAIDGDPPTTSPFLPASTASRT